MEISQKQKAIKSCCTEKPLICKNLKLTFTNWQFQEK